MHHLPAGPSLFARLSGALSRAAAPLRGSLTIGPRRAIPLLVLGVALAVLGIAAPVVSGAVTGGSSVSLDSSSAASAGAPETNGIRMGADGADEPASDTSSPGRESAAAEHGTTSAPAPAGATVTGSTAPASSAAGAPPAPPAPPASAAAPAAPAPTTDGTPTSPSAGTASTTGSASGSAPSSDTTSPSAGPIPTVVPGAGGAVLALLDDARAERGCAALTTDPELAALAKAHSTQMATAGVLGLGGLAGRTATVAQGETTAASVVAAWLRNTSDAAVLLDCDRTELGVAEVTGDGGPWWTAVMA